MTRNCSHNTVYLCLWATTLLACILCTPSQVSQAQVVINNGIQVAVKEDGIVIIKSALNNNGYLGNEGKMVIEGSFTNTDTTEGIGIDTFDISGNWINNRVFAHGQSTVTLSGGDQAIKGTVPTTFYNLHLAGSGIKMLDTVDAIVINHFSLNALEFSTLEQKLSIRSTNDSAISRSTGFVSSNKGGLLERYMDNDTVQYLFPLGSTTGSYRYRPLMISPDDSGRVAIAARFANADATTEDYDRSFRSDEVCELNPLFFHQIQRTLDSIPVSITMFYDSAVDGQWSQMAHWRGAPQWELAGVATHGYTFPFHSLTLANYSNFGYTPFALMKPVPVLDSTQTVVTNASCSNGNDGSICVSFPPLAGIPPFQYSWSNGQTTPCITGLTAGEYVLNISDSIGCSSSYTFTIQQPNNIEIRSSITNVSCKGGDDGSICIDSVSGEFPPFTYFITGTSFQFDSCLTGRSANEALSVTIRDSTGCTIILPNILITEPEVLTVSTQSTNVTCNGFNDGMAVAQAAGGTTPYFYQWIALPNDTLENDTLDTAKGLSPRDYGIIVTDGKGCVAINNSVTVAEPAPLTITAGPDNTIFTGFSSLLAVESVSGGVGAISYEWTPTTGVADVRDSSTTATPDATTTYTIRITDENDCAEEDTIRITVDVKDYIFPNAFIPNGNDNRYFKPVKSVTVELQRLEVYNRWGKKIFETADPSTTGWDGRHEGKLQPMDTYVYQAVMKLPDGSEKKETGDFILIW